MDGRWGRGSSYDLRGGDVMPARLFILPGLEKFSATRSDAGMGSVCTLERLWASPSGVIGDAALCSSLSCSAK